jgi:hypothetical protein
VTDTFAGIAPGGVPGFIAAQIAGSLAAVAVVGWLVAPPRAAVGEGAEVPPSSNRR